jgi:hypothetical protein
LTKKRISPSSTNLRSSFSGLEACQEVPAVENLVRIFCRLALLVELGAQAPQRLQVVELAGLLQEEVESDVA